MIQDIRCSKVSNFLIMLGYSISLFYQCIFQRNFIFWVQGILLPIILLFFLFYFKMLGAGDIKLLSVLGGFIGWKGCFVILMLSIGYSAIWSLVKMLYYNNLKDRFLYFSHYVYCLLHHYSRMPYRQKELVHCSYTIQFSVAIFIAFVSYLIWKGGMS